MILTIRTGKACLTGVLASIVACTTFAANAAPTSIDLISITGESGSILESTETSSVGGSFTSGRSRGVFVGDSASRQQELGILSYDTSVIPRGSTIISATLTLKALSSGGTPSAFAPLLVDVATGNFGSSAALELSDFEAAATASAVASFGFTSGTTATQPLNGAGVAAINPGGRTQLRVRFQTTNDADSAADRLELGRGSLGGKLTVVYEPPATPTPSPTVAPTATETPTATEIPTPSPTVTPTLTPSPSATPLPSPTESPTPVPTPEPQRRGFGTLSTESGIIVEGAPGIGQSAVTLINAFNFGRVTGGPEIRAIISFETGSLPDDAVIDAISLITSQGSPASGSALVQPLTIEAVDGFFGPSQALEPVDFQDIPPSLHRSEQVIPAYANPVDVSTFSSSINRTGRTQFRLSMRQPIADPGAHFIFLNGAALVVDYHVP